MTIKNIDDYNVARKAIEKMLPVRTSRGGIIRTVVELYHDMTSVPQNRARTYTPITYSVENQQPEVNDDLPAVRYTRTYPDSASNEEGAP